MNAIFASSLSLSLSLTVSAFLPVSRSHRLTLFACSSSFFGSVLYAWLAIQTERQAPSGCKSQQKINKAPETLPAVAAGCVCVCVGVTARVTGMEVDKESGREREHCDIGHK